MTHTFALFDMPVSIDRLSRWKGIASGFDQVVGFTFLGDFFLRNSETGQFAVLFTIEPELVPLDFYDFKSFETGYLRHPIPQRTVLKPEHVAAIRERLGELGPEQVYVPEPYPFVGGDLAIESYAKRDVWTYAELVGAMQGVGG